jgi:hypothetical protein
MAGAISPAKRIARWLGRVMRRDWDKRARENARHYVESSRTEWSDEDFFSTGEATIAEDILTDTQNIYQGRNPAVAPRSPI